MTEDNEYNYWYQDITDINVGKACDILYWKLFKNIILNKLLEKTYLKTWIIMK